MPDAFEWPSTSGWQTRYSLEFLQQMRNERWRTRRAEIVDHLETLLTDPLAALHSERLLREHRGLRSARFGWRYRLLFKLCGECRRYGDQSRFALSCCLEHDAAPSPDLTINILYMSDHYGDTPERFEIAEPPEANG